MRRRQWISGAAWLVIGLAICSGSFRLGLGTAVAPGAGLFPFLSGLLLVVLAAWLVLDAVRHPESAEDVDPDCRWEWSSLKSVLLGVLVLIVATSIMERAGVLISTFLIVFVFMKVLAEVRWSVSMTVSLATAAGIHLVFGELFGMSLPKGPLGALW